MDRLERVKVRIGQDRLRRALLNKIIGMTADLLVSKDLEAVYFFESKIKVRLYARFVEERQRGR